MRGPDALRCATCAAIPSVSDTKESELSDSLEVNLNPKNKKNFWDVLKIIGLALIAPAVALAGHMYSSALKEKEVSAKYVELAVDILKQDTANDENNEPIRNWAIEIINAHSQVKLEEGVRATLRESPIIKEELKVDFDVFISSSEYDPESMLRLAHVNHGEDAVTIEKVTVSGDDSDCQKEFNPKTVAWGQSSSYTDLLPMQDLTDCLGVDSLLKAGFKPYGVSRKPTLDIGAFGGMIKSYSKQNKPFFIVVEFSNSQSKGKFSSGAGLHFVKKL